MCDTRRAQHRGGPSANARTLHALLPSLLSYLLDCTATPRDQSRPSSLPTDSSLPTLSFALPARRGVPLHSGDGPRAAYTLPPAIAGDCQLSLRSPAGVYCYLLPWRPAVLS